MESCSRALIRCEIPEETPNFLRVGGESCASCRGVYGADDDRAEKRSGNFGIIGWSSCRFDLCKRTLDALDGLSCSFDLDSGTDRGKIGMIGDLETEIGLAS